MQPNDDRGGPAARDAVPRLGVSVPVPGAPAPVPVELLAVAALLALPGAWLVLDALRALPDAFDVFDFSGRLGLFVLIVVLLLAAIGGSLVVIAALLLRADRVGRSLGFVVAGTLILAVLISDRRTGGEVTAAICAAIGAGVLGLSPSVRDWFAAPSARSHDQPTSIVTARVAAAVIAVLAGVLVLLYLLIADVRGRYVLAAIVSLAIAGGAAYLARSLTTPDRDLRTWASAGAGAVVVLMVATGERDVELLVPVALVAMVPALLWLPADARRWYGDEPLDLTVRKVPAAGAPPAPAPPSPGPPTAEWPPGPAPAPPVTPPPPTAAASVPTDRLPDRFCTHCGAGRHPGTRFCVTCGTPFDRV